MGKIKILNCYAGLGGNRKLWPEGVKVTAVELNKEIAAVYKEHNPLDTVIIADAHEYLLKNYDRFDFIWGSPPCQSHSAMMKFTRHKASRYPDMALYQEIIFLTNFFKGKWVVENVVPYYKPLIKPTVKIGRHLFWSNFPIMTMKNLPKSPKNMINLTTVESKQIMMDWLGIHFNKNIYYDGNHCPVQILRNAIHPELGIHVFNQAMNQKEKQLKLIA